MFVSTLSDLQVVFAEKRSHQPREGDCLFHLSTLLSFMDSAKYTRREQLLEDGFVRKCPMPITSVRSSDNVVVNESCVRDCL